MILIRDALKRGKGTGRVVEGTEARDGSVIFTWSENEPLRETNERYQ